VCTYHKYLIYRCGVAIYVCVLVCVSLPHLNVPPRNACACVHTFHNKLTREEEWDKIPKCGNPLGTRHGESLSLYYVTKMQITHSIYIYERIRFIVFYSQQLLHGCVLLCVTITVWFWRMARFVHTSDDCLVRAVSARVLHLCWRVCVCARVSLQMLRCIVLAVFRVTLPSSNCSIVGLL
jgi:hypothetical protein